MSKILIAFAAAMVLAFALTVNGEYLSSTPRVLSAPVVEPLSWRDDWAVRPGFQGAYDWTGDGIIDWRDDFTTFGAAPWAGDYLRADWNRDGVVDWQDGWRKLDNTWATGSWDPTWRGEGWRPETVSVREVPAGTYADTEWRSVDGPWDTFGWGGAAFDWNRDGVADWRDERAWRGEPVVGVYDDFRLGGFGGVRERVVPSARGAVVSSARPSVVSSGRPVTTSSARPVTTSSARPVTTTTRPATTTTTKPATTTTSTKAAAKPVASSTKPAASSTATKV